MLNINSKKVIAAKYSRGVYADHYGACDLLEEVHTVKVLYANRAYDRHKLYELCNKFGIKTKILLKNKATRIGLHG